MQHLLQGATDPTIRYLKRAITHHATHDVGHSQQQMHALSRGRDAGNPAMLARIGVPGQQSQQQRKRKAETMRTLAHP